MHAHPVVADESAPADLRIRAIREMELRRTSRDVAVVVRRQQDAFDALVVRLAERSANLEVRGAAGRYVVRTRSPH
ncbi:MAG TPA: hypothetical protein VGR37_02580 [Longimicrobiaceae bacterium]|nr:hypothetical protein [Longimicrobiaceae bacterium]